MFPLKSTDRLIILLLSCLSWYLVEANIKGELCTDISTYDPVVFHPGLNCTKQGVGTPRCRKGTRRECITHLETICSIEKHEKVEMSECSVNTTMIVQEEQEFQEWDYKVVPHVIKHQKFNFTCQNKTRPNCETIWQTLPNGTKTSVQGACEDVSWLDCEKVPYLADFETIKHVKVPGMKHKYSTCREMVVPNTQMCWTVKEVLVSVCKAVPREECLTLEEKVCEPTLGEAITVPGGPVPWQRRVHKEKCLKPEGESPRSGTPSSRQRAPGEKSFSGQGFPFSSIDLRRTSRAQSAGIF